MTRFAPILSLLAALFSFVSITTQADALVGNVDIDLSVSQGEPVVSIPLDFPETADGGRPELSIRSVKGSGNPLLGKGFTFGGFSRLHRCQTNMDDDGRTSSLTLKENNFCINGKRLKKDTATGFYHRVKNSHSKFSYNPSTQTWEEIKGVRVYVYSPIGKDGKKQFEWRISEIKGPITNPIRYTYDSSSLKTKPTSISYADYKIEFNYDSIATTKSGVHGDFYEDNKRLKSISIQKAGVVFKEYKLGYKSFNNQDFLNSVQVCYNHGVSCLKPARINYEQDNAFEYAWIDKPQAFNKTVDRNHPLKSEIRVTGDVNADGVDDNCTIYTEDRALYCTVNGHSSKWLDFSGAFDIAYIQRLYTSNFDTESELQKEFRKARLHLGELSSSNLVDINRDGYADFCFTSNNHLYCAINNRNGFNSYQSMQALTPESLAEPFSTPAKIIWEDFNGDGFNDFCAVESRGKKLDKTVSYLTYSSHYRSYYEQTTEVSCYTNQQGQGFSKKSLGYLKPITTLLSLPIVLSADMDGDRINDLCVIELNAKKTVPVNRVQQTMTTGPAKSVMSCYSQDGLIGQFDLLKAASSGKTFGDSEVEIKAVNRFSRSVRLVDVSKDGVSDVCFVWNNQPQCIINNGKMAQNNHYMIKSEVSIEPDYGSMSAEMKQIMDSSLSFRDWNSDGQIDACWIDLSGFNCAYGEAGGFKAPKKLFEVPLSDKGIFGLKTIRVNAHRNWFDRMLLGRYTDAYQADLAGNLAFGPAVKMPDSNANGLSEFCYQHEGVTKCKDIPHPKTRIKSVEDSLGVKSRVEYKSSLDSSVYTMDQSNANKIIINPQKMLVSSLVVDNGLSSNLNQKQKNRFNYQYNNLVFKPNMGVMGFEQIIKTDVTKNKVTTTEYNMSGYPFYGLPKRNKVHYDGVLKSESHHQYKKHGTDKFFHVVPETITRLQHKDSVVEVKTTHYSAYDSHGYASRVSEKIAYRNDPNSRTVVNKQIRYEHRTFSPYILGLKTQVTTSYGDSAEKTVSTKNTFTKLGLLEESTLSSVGKDIKHTHYEYERYGQPIQIIEKDLITNKERPLFFDYEFQGGVLLLSETGNVLGREKKLYYETDQSVICQKPSRIVDLDDRETHFEYDHLCRTRLVVNPDNSKIVSQWQWDSAMQRGMRTNQDADLDISAPSVYKEIQTFYGMEQEIEGPFNKRITTYKDKLGRTLRTVVEGNSSKGQCNFNGSIYSNASIFIDVTYDRFGNKAGETRPYYDCIGGSAYNNQVWLVSQYDAQNRLVKYTTHHDKKAVVTTYQYQANKVLKYYQGRLEKTTQYNLFNKPSSITSHQGEIQFSYDVMGNLIQVKRNGLTTTMTYDSLGNKLSINDPDRGLWHYKYNAFGQLIWQKDANGAVINIAYDQLGRMVNKSAGRESWQWQYDAENAKGQISKEISRYAQTEYRYDELGRLRAKALLVDGHDYATEYHYDQFNQIFAEEHPSGLDIIREYDYMGRQKALYAPKNQITGYREGTRLAITQSLLLFKKSKQILDAKIATYTKQALKLEIAFHSAQMVANKLGRSKTTKEDEMKVVYNKAMKVVKMAKEYKKKMEYALAKRQEMEIKGLNRMLRILDKNNISGKNSYKMSLDGYELQGTNNAIAQRALGRSGVRGEAAYWVEVPDTWLFGLIKYGKKKEKRWGAAVNPYKYYTELASIHSHIFEELKKDLNERYDVFGKLLSQFEDIEISYKRAKAEAEAKEKEWKNHSRETQNKRKELQSVIASIQALKKVKKELDNKNQAGYALIWQATHYNANGALHSELFGNGYSTEREFDPQSKRITRISTSHGGKQSRKLIRDLRYTYDRRGNVKEQSDQNSGMTQTYYYNDRYHPDHLTGWEHHQGNTNIKETYAYDKAGNMTPEGVSNVHFDNNSHRILFADTKNRNWRREEEYQYDNNGNMVKRGFLEIEYDVLTGKANYIRDTLQRGEVNHFVYHVNGQILQKETMEGEDYAKVLHISDTLNKVTKANGDELWRHSLRVGGETVSVIEKIGKTKSKQKADRVAFIHRDLQGNSDRVTGLSGQEIRQYMRTNDQYIPSLGAEQVIRNPYGRVVKAHFVEKQAKGEAQEDTYRKTFEDKSVRNASAEDHEQVKALLLSQDFKLTYQDMIAFALPGYTGHQELQHVDLVNMNARMYDPVLGRFISADSMVPDATNWDDYNRYMYVRGNPMRYTDPSGHKSEDTNSDEDEDEEKPLKLKDVVVIGHYDPYPDRDSGCDSCAERRARQAELRRQQNEMSYAQEAQKLSFWDNIGSQLPQVPQGLINFSAGFGDGVSFGLTDVVRDWMGTNGVVNKSSSEYALSTVAGQLTTSTILVGGVLLRPFTAQSQVVTQWTATGQLGANTRWVMTGGNSYRNYVMAGGPQLQASYSQSVTATVSGSSLRWPSGGEWFKGFLGQRILK